MRDDEKTEIRTVTILLVEDDDIDAKGINRAFSNAKIANPIRRAIDGVEALGILRGEKGYEKLSRPFLLLVDINMPRMNGIEFIQALRKDEELKTSVAFILTTSKRDEDIVAAYNLNVAGYIVKENAGNDFKRLIDLIGHYWRIVELP